MKLHYRVSISGLTCIDDCKFRNDGTKIGSVACWNCKHHISTSAEERTVECNADYWIVRRKQKRNTIIMAILGAGVAIAAAILW